MNLFRHSRGWRGGRTSISENKRFSASSGRSGSVATALPGAELANPFSAIPMRPDDVEMRRDSRGLIHLRRRVLLKGLTRRVADWLRYDYARRLELDEYGSLYYGLADGSNTLCVIVDAFVAAPAPAPRTRQEIERAVVLFTRKLMTMNMLALKIPVAPSPI